MVRSDQRRVRRQPTAAALDIEELLRAQLGCKARLGDTVIRGLQAGRRVAIRLLTRGPTLAEGALHG